MEQENKLELEYTKYKLNDKVNVYKNGQLFFMGLVTKILDRGLILNPLKEQGGFDADILAGSYIPFQTNPDVVSYSFKIVK